MKSTTKKKYNMTEKTEKEPKTTVEEQSLIFEVGKLELKDNDVLVIRLGKHPGGIVYYTKSEMQDIGNRIESCLCGHIPPTVKIMVVPATFEFEVITK